MVRATFAGFDAALSSLRMNSKKLDIVGQNLANMNTEGYTRQELKTSSINYENPTSFYMNQNDVNVGFGVAMDEVRQLRDQFLDKQFREQNAKTGYNETISDSLKSISNFFDETTIDGIRSAFDNIQTSLTNMQDPSKVQDPVYEGELMGRMQALTSLLNTAAETVTMAEINEFQNLNGGGTSENGAIETINHLLLDIGSLNAKIKRNQILGNPALELQDQRNQKLDELSHYIPIEVENFSESYEVDGETHFRIYNYDSAGNICGRSDWPEDLRVSLVYSDYSSNPAETRKLTLVNGALDFEAQDEDGTPHNVGKVVLATGSQDEPRDTSLTFIGYFDENSSGSDNRDSMTTDTSTLRFASGTVQASLDMLSKSNLYSDDMVELDPPYTPGDLRASNQMNYYSYDYYMDRLDILAKTFAYDMNLVNKMGNSTIDEYNGSVKNGELDKNDFAGKTIEDPYLLLINKNYTDDDSDEEITAANISVSTGWVNGTTHIGLNGFEHVDSDGMRTKTDQGDNTDTILKMLEYMTSPMMEMNRTKTSYADYMNNVSTVMATDKYNNNTALTINKTVLESLNVSRDQLSGVSLDEEAANMMTFTTAYNAAARLMTALDETLQTLLGIGA